MPNSTPPSEMMQVNLSGPFGAAVWAETCKNRNSLFRKTVAGWLERSEWQQVEATYDQGRRALGQLETLGPRHADLAAHFGLYTPYFFMRRGVRKELFESKDPLAETFVRETLQSVNAVCLSVPATSFRRVVNRLLKRGDQEQDPRSEADFQALEALMLEAASLSKDEYQARLTRLAQAMDQSYHQIIVELPARLAQADASLNTGGFPKSPDERRSLRVETPLLKQNKQVPIVWPRLFCRRKYLNERGNNVFAQYRSVRKGHGYISVLVNQAGLGLLFTKHPHLSADLAGWDPCFTFKDQAVVPLHIITHELIHGLSDQANRAWDKKGDQAYLANLKKRFEAQYRRYHHLAGQPNSAPRQLKEVSNLGLSYYFRWLGQGRESLQQTSWLLNAINEAVTEAATLDILNLPDPAPENFASRETRVAYDAGIPFVRLILAGTSPLSILRAANPLSELVAVINRSLLAAQAARLLDFILETTYEFQEHPEMLKLSKQFSSGPLFNYGELVYQALTNLATSDQSA
jgi:hypothetical protein